MKTLRLYRLLLLFSSSAIVFAEMHASRPAVPATAVRNLSNAAPASVGFSPDRLQGLETAIEQVVNEKQFAGAVFAMARHGKVVEFKACGKKDLATGTPMAKDTIFRIFSMTKPVTAVAMMILYEQGKWNPDDPIAKYIPEFR